MNKLELIDVIVEKGGLFKIDVGKVLDVIIVLIIEVFKFGDIVIFVGFGIFNVKERVVCIGCNL